MTPDIFLPRGIRLNNPGNIVRDGDDWLGMDTLQDDPRFVRFEYPQDGLRAMMKILLRYQEKYGLFTVARIINRWAPPTENLTNAYVVNVAHHLKVAPNEDLGPFSAERLIEMAQAIALHENGPPHKGFPVYWFADEIYNAAAASALT